MPTVASRVGGTSNVEVDDDHRRCRPGIPATGCMKGFEIQCTRNAKLTSSHLRTLYWTSSRVAGTLSLDTSLGFPKTRQLTKHSGVTSTYLSDTFQIKAGGVVLAAQATDGSTRSAGTTTTYHQLICGGDPSCEVIRG